jgi:hypothetical protein
MEMSLVARQLGTVSKSLRASGCSTPNTSDSKMLITSSVESLRPSLRSAQSISSWIFGGLDLRA